MFCTTVTIPSFRNCLEMAVTAGRAGSSGASGDQRGMEGQDVNLTFAPTNTTVSGKIGVIAVSTTLTRNGG
jgi:hypothetical protein